MLKTKICLVCMTVALLFGGVSGIVAYLTDGDTVTNPFDVSLSDVEINEEFNPEPDGSVIHKKVRLQNTGNCLSFVRTKVLFSDSDIGDYCRLAADTVTKDVKGGQWVHGDDGYYYYTRPLLPGEYTLYLFKEIEVDGSLSQEYTLDVIVYSESYQADDSRFYDAALGTWNYVGAWELYQKNR